MACALDSFGHFFLILVGSTGDAARQNLALLVDELQQEVSIFIVNVLDAEFLKRQYFLRWVSTAIGVKYLISVSLAMILIFKCLLID